MEILRRTADKYGLVCLLHEKPFAGINGSGKHNNWSMSTDTGENLLNPGDNAARQRPVPGLLRRRHPRRRQVPGAAPRRSSPAPTTTTASGPTRPRRRSSRSSSATSSRTSSSRSKQGDPKSTQAGRRSWRSASACCRSCRSDAGDRNRTSPFAFTGNKFEFRAVGSQLQHRRAEHGAEHDRRRVARLHRHASWRADVKAGKDLNKAIQELLPGIIKESKKVIFNGDNYTEEWHKEAEKRGLPNLKNTVDALPVIIRKDTIELFAQVQGLQRAGAAEPVQHLLRELRQDGRRSRPT